MNHFQPPIPFVFFGSSYISVCVLNELEKRGLVPKLVVSTPDRPKGRKLVVTPTPVTLWARTRNIPTYTPERLNGASTTFLKENGADLYIVASYGKIIPTDILNLPKYKILNIHPSLLPKYRGSSPLQTMIVNDDKNTGTSIMVLDEEMDHGPILAQAPLTITEWPTLLGLKQMMAEISVEALVKILPSWIDGTLQPIEQDHTAATFTKKVSKEDGLITLSDDPYLNFRKIQAYGDWPSAYFFTERKGQKIRVKIKSAHFENGQLIIDTVVPEGKGEIPYRDL